MSTDNVTLIRPDAKGSKPPRKKRAVRPPNTFDMPDNLRLVFALEGVCSALEELEIRSREPETCCGLATAAAILSQMVRESLTNQSII
jgi:hypothetical protein